MYIHFTINTIPQSNRLVMNNSSYLENEDRLEISETIVESMKS